MTRSSLTLTPETSLKNELEGELSALCSNLFGDCGVGEADCGLSELSSSSVALSGGVISMEFGRDPFGVEEAVEAVEAVIVESLSVSASASASAAEVELFSLMCCWCSSSSWSAGASVCGVELLVDSLTNSSFCPWCSS